MKRLQRLATTLAVTAGALAAAPLVSAEDVDLELLLLIDTSSSVDDDEFTRQKQGYISAFRDGEVQEAVLSNANGVAVQVVQWSSGDNFVPLGWHLLRSAADCRGLASKIELAPRAQEGTTLMAPAIDKAMTDLAANDFDSPRQVIDVSGDGVCENWLAESTGYRSADPHVGRPWSEVLADRPNSLTINGISIGEGHATQPEIRGWYNDVLQQGPDSFAIHVESFEGFAEGIKTKLIREIALDQTTISYD